MAELVALLTPILWHTVRAQRLDRESAEDVVQIVWLRWCAAPSRSTSRRPYCNG